MAQDMLNALQRLLEDAAAPISDQIKDVENDIETVNTLLAKMQANAAIADAEKIDYAAVDAFFDDLELPE